MHNPSILPRTTVFAGTCNKAKTVMKLKYFAVLALLVTIFGAASSAFAQGSSSLSGLITDNSEAVVPAPMLRPGTCRQMSPARRQATAPDIIASQVCQLANTK